VRIGVHASGATQVGRNFSGKGVHEAARIAALAGGGEILTSLETAKATTGFKFSEPKPVTLKGITEPMETVFVEWH
jgi:class 3 adenylate cyclase